MTVEKKQAVLSCIMEVLNELIKTDEETEERTSTKAVNDRPVEMLTIKECVNSINGLSEHYIRKLISQSKIPYVRVGDNNKGKILVNKSALLDYLKFPN